MAEPEQTHRDDIWGGVSCDDCSKASIIGTRFKCFNCEDYDLCEDCYQHHDESHEHGGHTFVKLIKPYEDGLILPPQITSVHTEQPQMRQLYDRRVRVHNDVSCDACGKKNFFGPRFRCVQCSNYDLCFLCYHTGDHDPSHAFVQIDWPHSHETLLFSKSAISDETALQEFIQKGKENFNKNVKVNHRSKCDSCEEMIKSTRYQSVQSSKIDYCAGCYHSNKGSLSDEFYAHDNYRYSRKLAPPMKYPAREKGPEAARAAEQSQPVEHEFEQCSVCHVSPIVGIRYRCSVCDVSLCPLCYKDEMHAASGHPMWAMARPHEPGILLASRPITPKCLQPTYFGETHGEHTRTRCDTCKEEGILGPLYSAKRSTLCKHCYDRGVGYMDREYTVQQKPGDGEIKLEPRSVVGGNAEWRLAAVADTANSRHDESQQKWERHSERCEGCCDNGIVGKLYSCIGCDWNLCAYCFERGEHAVGHAFVRIDRPFVGEVLAGLREDCDGHLALHPESTSEALKRITDRALDRMFDSSRTYLMGMTNYYTRPRYGGL